VIVDVTCKTDRFNLSVPGAGFINDCCFGEDLSRWLAVALAELGVDVEVICMEDFGWASRVEYRGNTYLMCVAGTPGEDPSRPDYGEWHVMLERRRSLMKRLFGKERMTSSDPVVDKVIQVLRAAGFADVGLEP